MLMILEEGLRIKKYPPLLPVGLWPGSSRRSVVPGHVIRFTIFFKPNHFMRHPKFEFGSQRL